MNRRLLAAWTRHSHPYPPYVNASQLDDGTVEVTVRHEPGTHPTLGYPTPGLTAIAHVSAEDFQKFMLEVCKNFRA